MSAAVMSQEEVFLFRTRRVQQECVGGWWIHGVDIDSLDSPTKIYLFISSNPEDDPLTLPIIY